MLMQSIACRYLYRSIYIQDPDLGSYMFYANNITTICPNHT